MVTALLPVRNCAATLDAALESLHAQTHPLDRCIVVDDGSTDSTPVLLEQWQKKWRALEVVRTPGLGISRALNLGLERCTTEWVARMDGDDVCLPQRIESQLELAARDATLSLLGCETEHWPQHPSLQDGMRRHIDWANSWHTHEELERALWIDSPLPHPTWVVRTPIFKKIGIYNESDDVPEDYEWLHRFFAAARANSGLRAAKVSCKLLKWADWPERLTRTSKAYTESAFNEVKARYLGKRFGSGLARPVYVFGLGPKSKQLVPLLQKHVARLTAIIEVHPRRQGIVYQGTEVWSHERWVETVQSQPEALVIICLGTPESRARAEELCLQSGLAYGSGFISL